MSGGAITYVVHVCVGFPERRNALPFQHVRQNISLLAMLSKSIVLEARVAFHVT